MAETAGKTAEMLGELLDLLVPERMGEGYARAHDRGDRQTMLRLAAKHFRERPDWNIPHLLPCKSFDDVRAKNAKNNLMREVNVDWQFTGGHIDFLFNATSAGGALNHEWLWQLNRHAFWAEMASAYLSTGDEGYALAFQTQLTDWISQTSPPENFNGPGSAWRTIECGLRLMEAWPVAFSAFRRSPSVSDETILLMLASMHRQAEHLMQHFTKANWLMMETAGAYTFASLFPEFSDAGHIRSVALNRFADELSVQLLPDGMQYELSPDYHMVVFTCAADLYDIAGALGSTAELPEHYCSLMKKAADAYIALAAPGFTQPRTNDCYTLHTSAVIERALRIFPEEPCYQYVVSERKKGHAPVGETASRFLPYAGFCAMRSGWDEDAAYLCFDVGPLGKAHIHQDMLNIQLYKGRQELIFDDGGGQYEISKAREYALSAADHNTVLVDGKSQNRDEPLMSDAPIDCGWISNAEFDYAFGIYDSGFGPGQDILASHKREVRLCKPGLAVIKDNMASMDGELHDYEVLFHLDTLSVKASEKYKGAVCSDYGGKYDVMIIPAGGIDEEVTAVSGQTEPYYRGWYVGRNEAALHKATTVGRKVLRKDRYSFITLLLIIEKGAPQPIIQEEGGMLTVTVGSMTYHIDPEHLDR